MLNIIIALRYNEINFFFFLIFIEIVLRSFFLYLYKVIQIKKIIKYENIKIENKEYTIIKKVYK